MPAALPTARCSPALPMLRTGGWLVWHQLKWITQTSKCADAFFSCCCPCWDLSSFIIKSNMGNTWCSTCTSTQWTPCISPTRIQPLLQDREHWDSKVPAGAGFPSTSSYCEQGASFPTPPAGPPLHFTFLFRKAPGLQPTVKHHFSMYLSALLEYSSPSCPIPFTVNPQLLTERAKEVRTLPGACRRAPGTDTSNLVTFSDWRGGSSVRENPGCLNNEVRAIRERVRKRETESLDYVRPQ